MKKICFSLVLAFFAFLLPAQNDRYVSAMNAAVAQLDTARSATDFQAAANTFARIAAAEPGQWLPEYYAAFSNLMVAFPLFSKDAAQALRTLDGAQASLDRAQALAPKESELAVLQAYVLIGRVMENPMAKGAELSPKVFAELEKAVALDPANPRAPFLKGTYVLNMPEFYGGGAANAKPLFEQAVALFEQEKGRGLLPHWGRRTNAQYLEKVSTK
ncbi:MAG: hypothetical protein ABMA02_06405 [Saprospiraceae bacterium]